ncbi:MAG TPA: HAMP domain-containing sensor histidine kinase [Thermoanaerobaculia bacterium]|nr:HAMP domain-containing sensor histidine kinase [Thermoanaerobaculia bacterium]
MTMRWDHRRNHRPPPAFVRRMGCAFGLLIVLSAFTASSLVWLFQRNPQRATVMTAIGLAVMIALVVGFIRSVRRLAIIFGRQDRLRRQLMADVAHELRTPLSILQGRIEGLLDGVYPRDDARLDELLDETRHLSRLVEDLQTIANAEAGALDLRKELVDLAELIRDAAASFASIDVVVPEELPLIEVDPVRIREVLLNLLSNAIRYGGAVSIRATVHPRNVLITVRDTGPGIAPEELPRIFERFHKGHDSRGTGLGLAIARDLVRAHGGDIRAESEVGRGTVVMVTLPR